MIYFIADTHFGHSGIISLCDRPFADVKEMDMIMVELWNSKIIGNDTVYVVGDMFYRHGDPDSILCKLKGKKRLIVGNHDGSWMNRADMNKYFTSVDSLLEISDGKHKLVLCHYPLMSWKHANKSYMIHGHIHNNKNADYWNVIKNNPHILNAGVDVNGFWPVSFDELVINNECFKEGIRIGDVTV